MPGAIQPHGVMLVLQSADLVVERVSANIATLLGVSLEAALGKPLRSLFNDESGDQLEAVARLASPHEAGPFMVRTIDGRAHDAMVHRSNELVIVELEAHTVDVGVYHPSIRSSIARLQAATTIRELCTNAAREVRGLTGFDRVMVYVFDAEWHGEVVAEEKRDDLEPFLGLHYPASDIPAQARRLYTLNWLRLIADVRYTPAPLVPDIPARPLDMSHATLRSVSPIHIEYLGNMGVSASMSISLLRDGKLWGLIACHHYTGPKVIPFVLRDTAELIGQILSWQVTTREREESVARERDAHRVETEIIQSVNASKTFIDGLATPTLLRVTDAEGAAIVFEGEVRLIGKTPSTEQVQELAGFLATHLDGGTFVTDNLAAHRELTPELADVASGVLAVAIAQEHAELVIWFRPSTERTVSWAGNPNKEVDPSAPRLSPRGSFSRWLETIRGRSRPWMPWQITAASNLRGTMLAGVRKRAAELRVIADKLAEADRLKDLFLATVSHELRTPLNAIAGWAHLLRTQRTAPERQAHALEVIERNARTQTQLIEDLLDVSRMTSGKLTLEVSPVDLADVVHAALESLALSAAAKDIRVRPIVDTRASIILGDGKRLQQVVWNLVTNAIKFTQKGGRVDVVLRRVSSDIELSVIDNGKGIDSSLLAHVFESFRQGEIADRRGLGIGLAICRHIVELHGGTVRAESPGPGQGATFRVRLPLSVVQAQDDADSPVQVKVAPAIEAPLTGVRALIVEDEADSRDFLQLLLEEWGTQVHAFPDAAAALTNLESVAPDVLLVDIGLPGMSGLDFIKRVREHTSEKARGTPAVALTAYTRSRDRTQALLAGFQTYVPKPLDAGELLAVLRSLLGRTTPLV